MVDFIFTLVESLIFYLMVNSILTSRVTDSKKGLFLIIAALIDTLFVCCFPFELMILRIMVFPVFSFVLIHILYKDHYVVKIFFVLLCNHIFLIGDIIAGNFLDWIHKKNVKCWMPDAWCLFAISKLITIMAVLVLVRRFKKIDFKAAPQYWRTMDVIAAMFVALSGFFIRISRILQASNVFYVAYVARISLLFLIFSILVFYLLADICDFYPKIQSSWLLDLKEKEIERKLVSQETVASSIRMIRHNMNDNFANLSYFLKKNYIKESVKYIDGIRADLQAKETEKSASQAIQSGNIYIDAAVNNKINKCESNAIRIQFKVSTAPDLEITPISLTSMISNMLNNAIEANLKLPQDERYIDLIICCYKNYLAIFIRNPFKNKLLESKGLLATDKKDHLYHGYGFKSAKQSVENCGGIFQYSHEDGIFGVSIMLPLSPDNQSLR